MQLTHIRYLNVAEPLASGHPFLSAASGLVQIGEILCVVGDDEQHLAVFNQNEDGPGRLIRLLPGDLPCKKKKRKAVKPDFEILFQLPESGLICAMGSGSTPHRMRGAIIDPDRGSVTLLGLPGTERRKPGLKAVVSTISPSGASPIDSAAFLTRFQNTCCNRAGSAQQ